MLTTGPDHRSSDRGEKNLRCSGRAGCRAAAGMVQLHEESGCWFVLPPLYLFFPQISAQIDETPGYYPCDSPPQIGMRFLNVNTSKNEVFDIEPEAFQMTDNGNNNCTAMIRGRYDDDSWSIGQAWFQGKYVDLNWEGVERSVAVLKDKKVGAGGGSAESAAWRINISLSLLRVVLGYLAVTFGIGML